MTTLDMNRPVRPLAQGFAFATLLGAVVDWNDRRLTRNALNALTDRELDDIGLTRAGIESVVTRAR